LALKILVQVRFCGDCSDSLILTARRSALEGIEGGSGADEHKAAVQDRGAVNLSVELWELITRHSGASATTLTTPASLAK